MQPFDANAKISFQNILLATDFAPSSQAALLYSLAIARRHHSRIFLAHVVNPLALKLFGNDAIQRAVNDAWREAHTEMTNQLIAGRLEGIENHVVVTQGDVWEELARIVDKFKIDLLVVGTHGRSGVMKMLLGSTAEKIFRQATCPVLTVGPGFAKETPSEVGPKRVLYCTGFTPKSLNAGVFALSLAQQQQAVLGMLSVVKEVENDSPEERRRIEEERKSRLRALIPPDAKLVSSPEVFVAFGPISEAILKLSAEWKPDMIVLGVKRPEQEARRITWATAYKVVSSAPCPVLTVRTLVPD